MNERIIWNYYDVLHRQNPLPDSPKKIQYYQSNRDNIISANTNLSPQAAIVLSAHNEARLLPRTLASINSALLGMNHLFPVSVVVVNNASTDATSFIAQEFGTKLICEPEKGLARARQTGLESVEPSVQFIFGTDADTVVPYNWLVNHLKSLIDPNIVFTYGKINYQQDFTDDPMTHILFMVYSQIATLVQKLKPNHLLRGAGGANCGFSVDAAKQVGGYNTNLVRGSDTDLMIKLAKIGELMFVYDTEVITSNRSIVYQRGLFLFVLRKIYCNIVYYSTGHYPDANWLKLKRR